VIKFNRKYKRKKKDLQSQQTLAMPPKNLPCLNKEVTGGNAHKLPRRNVGSVVELSQGSGRVVLRKKRGWVTLL